ncbi:Oidioi.mRNA.OKI2018_I69.YSR.g17044.t1.cds [Oikopleura dioica]|uniref:Oidioi.mRNA.OKI2018_I69.YSR.g17044.t1.cds n=1 Tax=Oikopleura dioica TaxID=34765 RepID=A0ABN7SJT2_OIKDI|nr:Oidioi.mRNA.OKI2018_I69.YSR.g17044.t1.cds [Oikopleura dioica]
MQYPFENYESLKVFISHKDIKKSSKEPLRKCHVCGDTLTKAKAVLHGSIKQDVLDHYNACERTRQIFEETKKIDVSALRNHQSLTENLAGLEAGSETERSSSSSHSSSGSSQEFIPQATIDNSTDEDEQNEILNSTRESFGETMSHLGGAKKKVVEKVSREMSDQMNIFYETRAIHLPENSFNAHIAKHWHSVSKKGKIQILAACLPEEFLGGCADETVRKYLSYFNRISKKYARENHPQLMTRGHFAEALELKEKQLYDMDNIEEPEGRRLRKIDDADIHYILKYLFYSSDESPETDVFEAFKHRLRANTSKISSESF